MDKKNNQDKKPYPYKKNNYDFILSTNWKQEVLSKPNHRHSSLTSMMIGMQMAASLCMTLMAMS